MNAEIVITRKREEYGRFFSVDDNFPRPAFLVDPDEERYEDFVETMFLEKEFQSTEEKAQTPMITEKMKTSENSILHNEGGWPKDFGADDVEQIARFRKKTEKEEQYVESIGSMTKQVEKIMYTNNVVDMYEDYFPHDETDVLYGKSSMKICAPFHDPHKKNRFISDLQFSYDRDLMVGTSYSHFDYSEKINNPDDWDFYIWNLKNSYEPAYTLKTTSAVQSIDFHPKDYSVLIASMENGTVGQWDYRASNRMQINTDFKSGHKGVVTQCYWVHSKTNTDFASCAEDGALMYWDNRNLSEPIEVIWMDPNRGKIPDPSKASPCLSFSYDPSLATKVLVSCWDGQVYNINRKSKTPNDKVAWVWKAHRMQVNGMARNPFVTKFFYTLGDHRAHLWNEDIKDGWIAALRSPGEMYVDAVWSTARPSILYSIRTDGFLDCWDIGYKFAEPIFSFQANSEPLTKICCHKEGKLLAVGDCHGKFSLIEASVGLHVTNRAEKINFQNILDRESRREKALESARRDKILKAKQAQAAVEAKIINAEKNKKAEEERLREQAQLIDQFEDNVFTYLVKVGLEDKRQDPQFQELLQILRQELSEEDLKAAAAYKEDEKDILPFLDEYRERYAGLLIDNEHPISVDDIPEVHQQEE